MGLRSDPGRIRILIGHPAWGILNAAGYGPGRGPIVLSAACAFSTVLAGRKTRSFSGLAAAFREAVPSYGASRSNFLAACFLGTPNDYRTVRIGSSKPKSHHPPPNRVATPRTPSSNYHFPFIKL
jgi:hypothetical protein